MQLPFLITFYEEESIHININYNLFSQKNKKHSITAIYIHKKKVHIIDPTFLTVFWNR